MQRTQRAQSEATEEKYPPCYRTPHDHGLHPAHNMGIPYTETMEETNGES